MKNTEPNNPMAEKFMEFMESQGVQFVDIASSAGKMTIGRKLKNNSGRLADRGDVNEGI